MNHRPTDEQLGEMLKTPHFGKASELPAEDPVTATPMMLTLEQIKPYDRNPRRERNPLFDEIKESIRAKGGLNNPFNVTRRPGEDLYMIESGGNTRLQILNELYRETSDERFYRLNVLYQPWQSETHVLTAHLIENEKRGEMLFIDKALAIRELKQMFEQEDGKTLSFRSLMDRLREQGYAVNLNLLSRIDYALDVLLPTIPESLRAGLGRPSIERIRQLEKAFASYWTQITHQDETMFGEIFADALAENNRAEWDNDALRNTLEERMVECLDVPLRSLRLDIDALLYGKRNMQEALEAIGPAVSTTAVSDLDNPSINLASETTDTQTKERASEEPAASTRTPAETETLSEQDAPAPIQGDDYLEAQPDCTTTNPAPSGIYELRQAAYETALRLAEAYDLDACVSASLDWGLGFLLDLPPEPLIPDDINSFEAKQHWQRVIRQWVWWLLYLCSEETAQPERVTNLPEAMALRHLYLTGDQDALSQRLGQPAWIVLAYQLLADPLFPDDHFDAFMRLIRLCRSLRQHAGDDNDDVLWLERNAYAPT